VVPLLLASTVKGGVGGAGVVEVVMDVVGEDASVEGAVVVVVVDVDAVEVVLGVVVVVGVVF
jgi:hypothetical protein